MHADALRAVGPTTSTAHMSFLGAALHYKLLDPHKDMTGVADGILPIPESAAVGLEKGTRCHDVDKDDSKEMVSCLSYAPTCDIIASGSETGKLLYIKLFFIAGTRVK